MSLSNKIGELITKKELTDLVEWIDEHAADLYDTLVAKLIHKYPEEASKYHVTK